MYAIGEANVNYPMAKHFHSIHNSHGLETVKQNIHGGD